MSFLPGFEPPAPACDDHDGAGDEWYTPRPWVEAVRGALYGRIELDPCAALGAYASQVALATFDLRNGDDGLALPWEAGTVFCNPPYSDVGPWLRKCRLHARQHADVIALVPASVEIRAWHTDVWPHAAVVFPEGRPKFVGQDGRVHGTGRKAVAFVCWSGHAPAHVFGRIVSAADILALALQRRLVARGTAAVVTRST